ncbi:MAG: hypothetical protein R3F49_15250 [Planctomycetota bacterium]
MHSGLSLARTLPRIVCALACTVSVHAQVVTEDFSIGNTDGWGVEFGAPAAHITSGGNPGGAIELNISSAASNLPAAMILPGAVTHPWGGDFRALGVSGFRFDREVVSGSANFGTRPYLVLGNDNGTRTDFADDIWVWIWTGDNFQFGASPWTTISTPIPANDVFLPQGWGTVALPNNPNTGTMDLDLLWNTVIQDVDYVGIAMNTPFNGGGWFGTHVLRLDNLVLEGTGVGVEYCSPAAQNSTGAPAVIRAQGSPLLASNNIVLGASSLPQSSFGFFLTSRTQGFVANPGGSQGNLCLGGAIGRYVGAGQIQNSGSAGTIALPINLLTIPQPNGTVAAMVGDTWNFQAWYRDVVGGNATSNFTSGLAVTLQ